ncbi:MAG: hypothetical protein AB7W47_04885 [Calditrichaceae bacterium]
MTDMPKTPRGIKGLISRYEKALRYEKRTYGDFIDGAGLRYTIGPLYLLMDDVDSALKSFRWFEKNFPDDVGDPLQYLCWSLTLFKKGKLKEAENKLIQTMLLNLYLIPAILGKAQDQKDIYHDSSSEDKLYIDYIPPEYEKLWDNESRIWLTQTCESERFRKYRERNIELRILLEKEPIGSARNKLVNQLSELSSLKYLAE